MFIKNKLPVTLIVITLLVFGLLFILAGSYESRMVINTSFEGSRNLEAIIKDQDISQSFISTRDNISMFFVRLKNRELKNKDNFIVSIKDENGEVLRQIKISGSNIGDDDWVKFQIDPLYNIANKKLIISISSDTIEQGKAVEVYKNSDNEMALKIYSRESFLQTLKQNITDLKKRFTRDGAFAAAYLFLFISILGWLLWNNIGLRRTR